MKKVCSIVTMDVPIQESPVSVPRTAEPVPVQPRAISAPREMGDLDLVLDFLAELTEDAMEELRELAVLTRRQRQLRFELNLRLKSLRTTG